MAAALGQLTRSLSNGFQNSLSLADQVLTRMVPHHHFSRLSDQDDWQDEHGARRPRMHRRPHSQYDNMTEMTPVSRGSRVQVPCAEVAVPQDLTFIAPADAKPGQPVCVEGPHGPLIMRLPDNAVAGESCTLRFGPPPQFVVTVPENVKSGDMVKYKVAGSEEMHAAVPEGKQPGDTFEVHPPVLMVRVPQNSGPGQEVRCVAPDSQVLFVRVPAHARPGMYFEATYYPGRRLIRAETCFPQDLSFVAPQGTRPGDPICVQGPHGPLTLNVPEDAVIGERCSVRLGPPSQFLVDVPAGAVPGSVVTYKGTGGEELSAIVPAGKKPGDKFEVSPPVIMVRVPPEVRAGEEVLYETPHRQQLIVRVPEGLSPGQYFAATLEPIANVAPPEGPLRTADEAEKAEPADLLGGVEDAKTEAAAKVAATQAGAPEPDVQAEISENPESWKKFEKSLEARSDATTDAPEACATALLAEADADPMGSETAALDIVE